MRRSRQVCVINTVLGSLEVDLQKMVQRPQGAAAPERKVRRLDGAVAGSDEGAAAAAAAEASPGSRPSSGPPGLPRAPRASSFATSAGARRSLGRQGSTASSSGASPAHRASARAAAAPRPLHDHGDGTLDEDEALAIALAFAEFDGGSASGILAGAGAGIIAGRRSPGGHRHRARSEGVLARSSSRGFVDVVPDAPDGDEALALLLAREEETRFGGAPTAPAAHVRRVSGDAIDVDRMSYEELLALGERIGYASRPDRPTASRLSRLPTRRVGDGPRGEDDATECPICCLDYEVGDELRTLPCLHSFHCACIDKWLSCDRPGAKSCPVCHTEVDI